MLIKIIFPSLDPLTIFINYPLLLMVLVIVGLTLYFMLLIAIFTFFQYCILDTMFDYFDQQPFSFVRFKTFYWLHVFTFGVFSGVFFLLNSLITSLKPSYQGIGTLLLLLPFLVLAYTYLNLLHGCFLKEHSLKKIFKDSISIFKSKNSHYWAIIIFSIFLFLFYISILLIFRLLLFLALRLVKIDFYYPLLFEETISTVITALFFLILLSFNRILFYQAITVYYKTKH